MRGFIALSLLLGATSLGARPSQALQSPQITAVVRVLEGRATVATRHGLSRLSEASPELGLSEGAHVELGLHGSTQVRWPRQMSMTIHGYSSFGVTPGRSDGPQPQVEFLFLGDVDVELRRGSLRLLLPQGWTLELGRGSTHIKELVDGRLQVLNRGGGAVQVIDRSSASRRTPKPLLQGQSLLLPTL